MGRECYNLCKANIWMYHFYFYQNPSTICLGGSTTLIATGTIGSALINNDFNSSSLGAGWSATPGGVAFVNVLSCQPNYGLYTQNTDNSIFCLDAKCCSTKSIRIKFI